MTTASAISPKVKPSPAPLRCDEVGASLRRLLLRWLPLLAGLLLLGGFPLSQNPERLPPYLGVALPLLALLYLWCSRPWASLPILPVYAIAQAIVYAGPLFVPVLVADSSMAAITPSHLRAAGFDLAIWFTALTLGWRLLPGSFGSRRPLPALSTALEQTGPWPAAVAALAAAMGLLLSTGLYWNLSGPLGTALLSPFRTVQGILVIVASFTGAYALARGRLLNQGIWLLAMLVLLVQGLSSLLLSSIQIQVFSTLAGLWLARAPSLIPITVALLVSLSVLHNGKAEMRARYWNSGVAPSNPVQLFSEWIEASLVPQAPGSDSSRAGLLNARLNSLGNLAYVEDALQRGIPTMGGQTFAVIPQVLMPRVLNSEKVRSQEGQVLLNLHFGRQRTREDTEKAYIAWGLLTESIANYGQLWGPAIVGLATGALIRLSENIGRHQPLLSTPGLVSLFLLFAWVTAYESAASTFAAMVFQFLVAILALGWYLGSQQRRQAR